MVHALRSRVQDPFWPLIEFVPGSPWFNFSAALVNSQLVCLRSGGILIKFILSLLLLLFCSVKCHLLGDICH